MGAQVGTYTWAVSLKCQGAGPGHASVARGNREAGTHGVRSAS